MKVKIAKKCYFDGGSAGFKEVVGKRVIIHGFEDYEFALTRAVNRSGYTVTELSSGFAIGPEWEDMAGYVCEADALTYAAFKLNSAGRKNTARAIKSAIKRMGGAA